MPNFEARSAVYKVNSSGPSTEPCGTEQVTWIADDDVSLPYITQYDLPDK